ncbi:hypothetical protein Ciccas_000223 [Cichlidogyrus casuarinus]|uniref:ubiquitinyl hydrolase 1 n=1 Tax=Cichlidogyrus casuarinus TaxID=1844966 RepID=A0ABD2QNW6_9PLAT
MELGEGDDLKNFYANLCKKEAPLPQMVRLLVMWPSSHDATKLVMERLNESYASISTETPCTSAKEDSPKPSLSLVQCLQAYTAPEPLDSADFRCPNCRTFNTIQTRITKLPPVLILHLTRFRQNANDSPDGSTKFEHSKSSLLVKFPIKSLDMSKFLTLSKSDSKDLIGSF